MPSSTKNEYNALRRTSSAEYILSAMRSQSNSIRIAEPDTPFSSTINHSHMDSYSQPHTNSLPQQHYHHQMDHDDNPFFAGPSKYRVIGGNKRYEGVDTYDRRESNYTVTSNDSFDSDYQGEEQEFIFHPSKPSPLSSHRSLQQKRWIPLVGLSALTLFLVSVGIGYAFIDWYLPDFPVGEYNEGQPSTTPPIPHEMEDLDPYPVPEWPVPTWDDHGRLHDHLRVKDDLNHVLVPILGNRGRGSKLLTPITRPPHSVMLDYYLTGKISSDIPPLPFQRPDIVYLWVNGSSPYLQDAMESKALEENVKFKAQKKHWRDNGELRGAIRSAVHSLKTDLGRIHVLAGDYGFDKSLHRDLLPYSWEVSKDLDVRDWKIGQIADWLNWEAVALEEPSKKLTWHFHDEVFRLPRGDNGVLDPRALPEDLESEEEWREQALPSFDSFEIESRIGWLEGLSDNFIMSNDDMFMLGRMAHTDFHHPLLGPVFRFDTNPSLLVRPVITPDLLATSGEWGGLQHASYILSKRFPMQSRMYIHHVPKGLTKSLFHEASIMFAKDLSIAATRAFRESRKGVADIEIAWLVSHLRVERWREALLWTWVVGKLGGPEGVWDSLAREHVRRVLDVREGEDGLIPEEVEVVKGERRTLEMIREVSKQAGWQKPKNTKYVFSSMDGHLPHSPDLPVRRSCVISLSRCFPSEFWNSTQPHYSATQIFTNLAFSNPSCGDCLIDALINASGELGLSEVFPDSEMVVYPPSSREAKMWDREEPMLPLTDTWQEADFSLENVVLKGQDIWEGVPLREDGGVRMRDWCLKLLSRYAYVHSSSDILFSQIHNQHQMTATIMRLDLNPQISMVCLNDDQPSWSDGEAVKGELEAWMTTRWGHVQVDWERRETLEYMGEEEYREGLEEYPPPRNYRK